MVSVLVISVASVIVFNRTFDPIVSDIGNVMVEEELRTIGYRVPLRVGQTREVFMRSVNALDVVKSTISYLEYNATIVDPYNSYHAASPVLQVPPGGLVTDAVNSRLFNQEASGWFRLATTPGQVESQLNITSSMDNVYRAYMDQYVGLYIGYNRSFVKPGFVEQNIHDMWQHYPYISMESLNTMIYQCQTTLQTVVGYRPSCRIWYSLAVNSNSTIFTPPYIDATTSRTLITAAINTGIGVVGIDLSITNLQSSLLSGRISTNGEAFIMDADGNAVIRAGLQRDRVYGIAELIYGFPVGHLLSTYSTEQVSNTSYVFAGDTTYLFYMGVRETPYIVVYSIPLSDIQATAAALSSVNNDSMTTFLAMLICLGVALLIAVTIITLLVTYRVARAFRIVTSVLRKIKNGELHNLDIEMGAIASDVDRFIRNVNNMIYAFQFGNQAYYNGDMNKALQHYAHGIKLMRSLKNERGMGICYNNIGTTLDQLGNKQQATVELQRALDNVETMLQADNLATEDMAELKHIKAGRLLNMGIHNANKGDYSTAIEYYQQALPLYEDYPEETAQLQSQMALAYLAVGDRLSADQYIKESVDLAISRRDPSVTNVVMLNKAQFLIRCGEHAEAIQYLEAMLSYNKTIPRLLMTRAAQMLVEAYTSIGNTTQADLVRAKIPTTRSQVSIQTDIVLDQSGSMTWDIDGKFSNIRPSRQKICKDAIMTLIDSVPSNVLFNMWLFDVQTTHYFSNEFGRHAKGYVSRLPRPGGGTNFYSAVRDCLSDIKTRDPTGSTGHVVAALTDGCTSDVHVAHSIVVQLNHMKHIKLYIITVGDDYDRDGIRDILSCTDQERDIVVQHLDTKDTNRLTQAFTVEVQQAITSGFVIENL